jgi:hypothetical protein
METLSSAPSSARALTTTFDWPTRRAWRWALVVLAAATLVLMREQLLAFASAPDLGDPLFSMWRLGWIAHQLPRDPLHLFDANIFYPARHTLAYSDPLLLPGVVAAPALWLGAPVTTVYTTLMVGSFFAAGLAMFALLRAITTRTDAALIAAMVFAFDPFRFAQYSHLESELTFWMPLTLLCLLRTLTAGGRRDAIWTGLLFTAQVLSGLYMAAYFAVSLGVFVVCWIAVVRRPPRRVVSSLVLAGLIAIAGAGLGTAPNWIGRSAVGERQDREIQTFSAFPRDYLTASRRSAVYRMRLHEREEGERELFPGFVTPLLGAAALIPPIGPVVVPALVAVAVSVDASFGVNGFVYPWLERVPGFRAFRVPARFRAIAGLYLAILAGLTAARLSAWISSAALRRTALTVLACALVVDVYPSFELQPVWKHPPGIYDRIPDGAVMADMPLAGEADPQWHATMSEYFSTFHWHPTTNGYSGFAPAWYAPLAAVGASFPSDQALDAFHAVGTEYFVLHEGFYHGASTRVIADADAQPRLQLVATATWEEGQSRLYRLLR